MTKQKKANIPISSFLSDNENYLKQTVGLGVTFDVGIRKFQILDKEIGVLFVNGLCDTNYLIHILEEAVDTNEIRDVEEDTVKLLENRLIHQQVSKVKTMDEVMLQVLSGLVIIFVEGETEAFAIDVRSYPGRTPTEPDTEKVVRGARDGFVENIIVNTGLIRRRIRDPRLRNEIIRVGDRSQTDICITYVQDVANPDLVKIIKKELESIEVDGITMADKTIEEFLVKQGYNPFPLIRYTERPDVAANHLLEGHVLVIVDTSPSVMITPTTYFHHVQHAEEFRQNPAVGTFLRWVRFVGIIFSVFLLPFWLVFVFDPTLLPEKLAFIGPNKMTHLPIILQIIMADIGLEFLRMASIHTPTPLSSATGLISAILIGQIAIDVGLFVPEVILYTAVSMIGIYATPSYELGLGNKLGKLFVIILTGLFHEIGFIIGMTMLILFLTSIKSLQTPYLWPFLPFDWGALKTILLRPSMSSLKVRPSIVHPQNIRRQK
ncbi:spore germination protein [Bacillus pseudomycoides]|uniref:Spore germination protein n=1 Tax=Bacillus pseudomycoides TaxID=64104 RepID=A0A2C3QZN1_9BACI|nr:spore germination protein [Bacillus pseudomycoides]PDY48926.1 spore germination protein [Bacillus pseudomycoides]PEA85365.1 spore germination protein [Bacillus pseudomycoides]PED09955.1 spore germination protein [Bacillus pseudomycoides]PED70820.1 spore germination protein [Bacillus pseudomycoides]PEE41997.1 spore germination protein [Bacillus pseudomycoides]